MRIIKDNTIDESVVKCHNCGSVFAFTDHDLTYGWGIYNLKCPCCHTEDYVFNYEEYAEECLK